MPPPRGAARRCLDLLAALILSKLVIAVSVLAGAIGLNGGEGVALARLLA